MSFCEEKYATISTNLTTSLLCKVTGECVSDFTSVQDKMWTCKSVYMLIVHLHLGLWTKSQRCEIKLHTFSHLHSLLHLMLSFLHSTLRKFSASRFVYMHIQNVKMPNCLQVQFQGYCGIPIVGIASYYEWIWVWFFYLDIQT